MSDELRAWLSKEIKQRGWSHKELTRRSKVSAPLISQVLAGDVPPTAKFCIKVAQALDEPPEKVLRLARILPTSPALDDPTKAELHDLIENMPPDQRKELLRYARYLFRSGHEEG